MQSVESVQIDKSNFNTKPFLSTLSQFSEYSTSDSILNSFNYIFNQNNPYWQIGISKLFWVPNQGCVACFLHPADSPSEYKAYFGFWTSVNDISVHNSLLQSLEWWAIEQGASELIGPINFKTHFDYRLRIDSFNEPAFWGEPENKQSSPSLLENTGYTLHKKYYTQTIENLAAIRNIANQKLPPLIKRFKNEIKIHPFTIEIWEKRHQKFLNFANSVFSVNPEFQKINEYDWRYIYNLDVIKNSISAKSFYLSKDDNEILGICFNLVNPNDPETLMVKSIGLHPQLQGQGKVFLHCLFHLFQNSKKFSKMVFCLMNQDNMAHRLTQKYCTRSRTYGLFKKRLKKNIQL